MTWWRLSSEQVLAVARRECARRGWPWQEPVRVSRRLRGYRVWTNSNVRDNNPWYYLDRNGRVTRAGYARRGDADTHTT
jgi:hypothetical protein